MNGFGGRCICHHRPQSGRRVTKKSLDNSEGGIAYGIKVIASLMM